MRKVLRQHWPEYFIEAATLGIFMLSAVFFTALLSHPSSPLQIAHHPFLRRAITGLAMGLTAICLIYSPWGQRSGAHMNPALTLTFLHLGKIKPWDAFFYIAAQMIGGVAGVGLAILLFGKAIMHESVNYVVTIPGPGGIVPAFIAETAMACAMMLMSLLATNSPRFAPFAGVFAGILVFTFITFESPLSGMSINPARTLGSALPSGIWTGIGVYFTAPLLGMFAGALAFRSLRGRVGACPKFFHGRRQRCIFCGHPGGV